MIKATLITLTATAALGSGFTSPPLKASVTSFTPEAVALTTGPVIFELGTDGFTTDVADISEVALVLTTQSGRTLKLNF